ncbi:S9 family peptidase [Streptacidiphilus neutrinimicus]|uniref:S9 family peptidase n=1 Tax=Streptacidiphilus neutrinimicus TaxID=105420 RepID=UPI000ADE736C|nr:prolyl oligopeptidase family serine peptidase [Streptacidiphilus neutrinimicus]
MELTPELMVDGWSPSQVAVAPDGRWVVYVVQPVTSGGPGRSALWLAPVDGGQQPRQLTDGKEPARTPRWTADSSAVLFLAGDRLERIGVDGGDRTELLHWDGEIVDHHGLPDGTLVLVGAQQGEDGENDVILWCDARPGDALWTLAPGDGAPQRLEALGDRHVVAVEPRPDGEALAVVSWEVPDEEPGARTARLHVVDVRTRTATDLGPAAYEAGSPAWWQDADAAWHVSYLAVTPPGLVGGLAVLDAPVPAAGGAPVAHRNLTEGMDACPTELLQTAAGPPLALFAEGLDSALYRLDPASGRFERLTAFAGSADGLAVERSGDVVALRLSTSYAPYDVYACRLGEPPRRLSDTRPHYRAVAWGAQERLRWRAADGLDLDGLLVLPPGRTRADGPFPLHVMVHGGPYERYVDMLQFNFYLSPQWLAANGHAVLLPNPRGSQGHGHAFAARVAGAIGGAEFTDTMAAVDLLVAEGVADPEGLSVSGWSHGGFMAAWAVTRTDRFRAAIVGAGIADWGLQIAHGELGAQEAALCGSTGWEGPGPHPHDAVSPISYASRITTPVLIVHGEQDTNVPLSQARYLQRALSHHGVPHEVAVYPGGGHYIARRDHQLDILRRTADFLARHVHRSPGGSPDHSPGGGDAPRS